MVKAILFTQPNKTNSIEATGHLSLAVIQDIKSQQSLLNRSLQASHVIYLPRLLTSSKTTNNENVLDVAADPVWGGKSFERILIK
ncbi:hypothetical protein N7530_003877 [Penicillium desertorum]|uniref:Uncharacterized protein n=1 Tax=Penicillium desertorum TaxID=1303715 RepID=A0A9W9WX53_9EURO|nr:hypothetical protein N7530_003877 [Penicillium desertorum]